MNDERPAVTVGLPGLLREHLTPGLRRRGYKPTTNRPDEGVWGKKTNPDHGLRVTNHAGRESWSGMLSVEFHGPDFAFLKSGYLDHAPAPVKQAWQQNLAAVITRASAQPLVQAPLNDARAVHGSTWPWVTVEDLVSWLRFVVDHFDAVEQAAVSAAESAAAWSAETASELRIWATREHIVEVLFRFDERDLCQPMWEAGDATWHRIMSLAAANPAALEGRSATLDTCLAAAAIEVLTAVRRLPSRQRPKPEVYGAKVWQHLGLKDPYEIE